MNTPIDRRGFLMAAGVSAAGGAAAAFPVPPAAKRLWAVPDAGWAREEFVSADGSRLYTWKTENGRPLLIVWDLTRGKRVRTHSLPVSETKPEVQFSQELAAGRFFVCEHEGKILAV